MDNTVLKFPKLGHHWLDSGLVGLAEILKQIELHDVRMDIEREGLILTGKSQNIQKVLEDAYERLINDYYNLSTQKQKDDYLSYNFYYDSKKDEFFPFPKRKSVGIAGIIADIAPRPTGYSLKWERKVKREVAVNGKIVKKDRGILPQEYAYLQEKLDKFLDNEGLNVTTSGLLVDGPNAVKPKVKIRVKEKKSKGHCFLCGQEAEILEDASQTIYPLITGASGIKSFNSTGGKPEKICWRCAFVGKFVPVNGFYLSQGDSLYIFLPYSDSLRKMSNLIPRFGEIKEMDPNLYKNFQQDLGAYYQHTYEATFAFLYAIYNTLLKENRSQEQFAKNFSLDLADMLNITMEEGILEFLVVHTKNEGSTFSSKTYWVYKDTFYLYRLVNQLEMRLETPLGKVLNYLVDFSQKKNTNKTFIRNKVLGRILQKQSILDLIERYLYQTDLTYVKPLYDLVLHYELLLKEEDKMFQTEQEAAVALGKNIGNSVAKSSNGKKGDLFTLRKCRTKVAFLEQLNRLQFKLDNFVVPKDVYEGKLTDENFEEFKSFALIAALNSYNYFSKGGEK